MTMAISLFQCGMCVDLIHASTEGTVRETATITHVTVHMERQASIVKQVCVCSEFHNVDLYSSQAL